VPDILVLRNNRRSRCGIDAIGYLGDQECDLDSKIVWPEKGSPRCIGSAYYLRQEIGYRDGRSAATKRLKTMLSAAEQYEASVAAAKEASCLDTAREALYWVENDVRRVAQEIAETPAVTTDGLLIKARAITSRSSISDEWGKPDFRELRLANDIFAVFGQAVAA